MGQYRWPLLAITLAVIGVTHPAAAGQDSSFTGPPVVPKTLVPSQFFPAPGRWISTVDNFNGLVAVANVQGTGKDNRGNSYNFEVDVRAMQGNYIDPGGHSHRGTFCFT